MEFFLGARRLIPNNRERSSILRRKRFPKHVFEGPGVGGNDPEIYPCRVSRATLYKKV